MNPSIEAKLHYFLPRQKALKVAVIAAGIITLFISLLLIFSQHLPLLLRVGFPFMMITFFMIIVGSAHANNAIHDQLLKEIEERKKAQDEAHNSNLFVNAIYENIPNMVFVKGGDELRYRSINKAGEDLIGFTREELLGKCDHDFFPKEEADFFRAKDKEVFATILPVIAEEQITTTTHGVRWLRTKKIGVRDEHGNHLYMIGISEDITELKEKQEQLNHYNSELEKKIEQRTKELTDSNKELEQFAYVASHDLQEPLRMVSSFLQLLTKRYNDQLDDAGRQYINFAVDGSERMKVLINDLLMLSRVGTTADETVSVDCNGAVQDVLKIYEQQISEDGAVVEVSHLPVIKAIKTQVEQLFQNLVGNALKYRGTEAPVISVGCSEEGSRWKFYVKDNGIGIDKKFYDKVFIIFQRLHGKNEYSGTGIGLAICKKIVEKHGGKIWIESEMGKGSTFYFTFPRR
jgi:PAS domain S-box-containing protein